MPDYTHDLFLSYAQADSAWVRSYFTPALGLPPECVIQPSDFRPGVPLFDELERAVKGSRYTLLILTPAFLADQWASMGEQLAAYLGVAGQAERIIPLVLQPCELPLRIEFRVRLDCTEQDEWDTQVGRLRSLFELPEPGEEDIPCPYPGMVPFSKEDARHFYGREDEIEFMLQHLRHQSFLLVVGASGSGKSSLITAGLLPKLASSDYFQKRPWLVLDPIRPGVAPWENLTRALGGDPADIDLVVTNLLAQNPGCGRVLLVVDQFEEIFTQGVSAEEQRFIKALKRLREHDAAAVIVAMRADFYGDLLKSELWPIDHSQRLDVAPLKGDGLRRAIEKPAEDLGVYVEGRLVDRLMSDASDAPGALPLLQETLRRLWHYRLRRFLPYSAYASLAGKGNGLAAAIAQKADATLADLSDPARGDRNIARRIFLRLVQFGEGRADTRRQQPKSALCAAGDTEELFARTLEHLSNNRLIALSGEEEQDGELKADIAHEALFQGWPTLTGWIGKYREHELTRRDLDRRAADWDANGRSSERLLNRVQLVQATEWLAKPEARDVGHSEALPELVVASRRHQERARIARIATAAALFVLAVLAALAQYSGRRTAEARRVEAVEARNTAEASRQEAVVAQQTAEANRQAAEAAKQVAETNRQQAVSAQQVAETRRQEAEAAKQTAEDNRTLALRNESHAWAEVAGHDLETDPVASLWWSSRALPSSSNVRPPEPSAEYQLRAALQQSLERRYANAGEGHTAPPIDTTGPEIATGGPNLTLWPHELGSPPKQITGTVESLGWQPDRAPAPRALYAYGDGVLTVWQNDIAFRHDLPEVGAAAWRPNAPGSQPSELAVISGKELVSWPYTTSEPKTLGEFPANVSAGPHLPAPLAWSARGNGLAAWDTAGDLLIYRPEAEKAITNTLKLPHRVESAAWSPDGKSLVALMQNGGGLVLTGDLSLAKATTFTQAATTGADVPRSGVIFVDGERFITWGLNGSPKLWSLADLKGGPKYTYQLGAGTVAGLSLDPAGKRFAAFLENGDVMVAPVDLGGGDTQPVRLEGHSRGAVLTAWNGDLLATGGSDGTVRVWDLQHPDAPDDGQVALLYAAKPGTGLGLSYVSALEWLDGGRLFAAAEDGSMRVWQVLDGDGKPLCGPAPSDSSTPMACAADSRALRGHDNRLTSLQWLDANTLLSADADGAARRWSLQSAETRLIPGNADAPKIAVWNPDGSQVLTYAPPNEPGDGIVWDVATGSRVATVAGPIEWADWTALGLFVQRDQPTLARVNPKTGADEAQVAGAPASGQIIMAAVHGPKLAAATKDGMIYVWEALDKAPLVLTQQAGNPMSSLAWSPDGNRLLGAGNQAVLWDLESRQPAWTSTATSLGSCKPEFSPDGSMVAGCLGTQVYVWDAATGKTLWSSPTGGESAKGVAWRAAPTFDGTGMRLLLLEWARDTARLWEWDWAQTAPVGKYTEWPELNLATISPDGAWLATTNDAGDIRLWNLSLEDPQALLKAAAGRITRVIEQ